MKPLEWLKKHKNSLIISAVIILSLTAAFFFAEQPNQQVPTAEPVSSGMLTSSTLPAEESPLISEKTENSQNQRSVSSKSSDTSKIVSSSLESTASKQPQPSKDTNSSSASSAAQTASSPQSEHQTETTVVTEVPQLSEETEISDTAPPVVAESSENEDQLSSTQPIPESQTQSTVQNTVSDTAAEPSQSQQTFSEPPQENLCTLSISCMTAVNSSNLNPSKKSIVPSDGWILHETTISFNEGESVFDVTKNFCIERRIPFEFSITPVYNSAYIEGINNLYQFDCGSASGWVYCVNGEFANYSCSEYTLKSGDKIEWLYTCDLGRDVGNEYQGG